MERERVRYLVRFDQLDYPERARVLEAYERTLKGLDASWRHLFAQGGWSDPPRSHEVLENHLHYIRQFILSETAYRQTRLTVTPTPVVRLDQPNEGGA